MINKFFKLLILTFSFLLISFNISTASVCPFTSEMKAKDENSMVKELQTFLKKDPEVYTGPITGFYGEKTIAGVSNFQEKAGLLKTGIVDSATLSILCKVYLAYTSSEPMNIKTNASSNSCFLKTMGLQKGYFDQVTDEVKSLQTYLNQKGAYSENNISGYFGKLTETALKKFQANNNLTQSGIIDDSTFKAICGFSNSNSNTCPFITNDLSAGYFDEPTNEVKTLQVLLASLNLLSPSIQSGYFGNLTTNAVKLYQSRNSLTSTGILNLETRASLCKTLNLPLSTSSQNPYESQSSSVDLAISDFKVTPEKVDINTKIAIIVKVKNIGSKDALPVKTSIYLNEKEEKTNATSKLKPGEEDLVIVHNWTCTQKGIYALKVFVDSTNSLIEQNKYNNVLVYPINCGNVTQKDFKYICNSINQCEVSEKGTQTKEECQASCKGNNNLPDLTIEKFEFSPKQIKVGENASILITEKNIGKADVSYHKITLSSDDGKSDNATFPPIKAGDKITANDGQWSCATPGTYTFKLTSDPDNEIKESDELNNSATFVMKCSDKAGNVPDKEETEKQKEKQKEKENPKDNPADQTPPEDSPKTPIDEPSKGKPNLFKSNKPPAKINKKSGGLEVSFFSLTPVDCYNCPMKRCGAGGCGNYFSTSTNKYGYSAIIGCSSDFCINPKNGNPLSFYRESPHEVTISYNVYNYNNLYKSGNTTNCSLSMDDGTVRDCSFTGFAGKTKDYFETDNYSGQSFKYTYTNTTDKPIEFCPKIKVSDGKDTLETALLEGFCDSKCKEGNEDASRCIMVYPEGWGFQDKDKLGSEAAYLISSFTASPNPGKVNEKTTFYYTVKGLKDGAKAWCRIQIDSNPKHVRTFECTNSGSYEYTYSTPGTYTPVLSADESISFLDCAKSGLNNVPLVIVGADGSISKNTEDSGEGLKTPSKENPVGCNLDFCYVCNPQSDITKQCEILSKAEYSKSKYSNLKRFEGILACRDIDSPCYTKYECKTNTAGGKSCSAVPSTTQESSTVFKNYQACADACGAKAKTSTNIFSTTGSFFSNLLNGLFKNSVSKYSCNNGTCEVNEKGTQTKEECTRSCFGVNLNTNLNQNLQIQTTKPSININSNLNFNNQNINIQNTPTTLKVNTNFNLNTNLNLKATTTTKFTPTISTSPSFKTNLNIQAPTITKYKCSNSTCIVASSSDTQTYDSKSSCESICTLKVAPKVNNFDFNFNQ